MKITLRGTLRKVGQHWFIDISIFDSLISSRSAASCVDEVRKMLHSEFSPAEVNCTFSFQDHHVFFLSIDHTPELLEFISLKALSNREILKNIRIS
ncbi:MAG TPA: hypothetical protein VNJ01_12165 [Bacteriovoracaceae bacterium]|nr:hypothetical protein [Bacteriovoracaceae bacterium]